jgi:hypothetical protein
MKRESHFGAVLFSRWLNAIVLQAKPKIAVGFGETNYPHQKEQDTVWCPVLFGAGKRT